ncbi:hypothetical protein CORC01_08809 [Colletotrichum orchidophilum]|uniref:Uncharacterized protein n=1 Tax=Colletotrichum orchidophilum TaxID=1209926 RepID=A0A1G4B3I4_9PEZI|nr:uncharacterized protein CORC01_08809 [Colletotrichum orchidophilum]OHE95957.1 hypothetical protein CORC01_08809 [Colletotrichum orchidophilum]
MRASKGRGSLSRGSRLFVAPLDDIHAIPPKFPHSTVETRQARNKPGGEGARGPFSLSGGMGTGDTRMAQDSLILSAKRLLWTLSQLQTVFTEEGRPPAIVIHISLATDELI